VIAEFCKKRSRIGGVTGRLRQCVQPEIAALKLALAQVPPLGKRDVLIPTSVDDMMNDIDSELAAIRAAQKGN